MRPTVHDIAAAAGVSLATVDRVLNQRPGVRHVTREKVETAIREIGYVRDVAAANLAKGRTYPFVFIVPASDNSFMHRLNAEVQAAVARSPVERTHIRTVEVPAFDPAALVDVLDQLGTERPSGIALVATDAPEVRDAVDRLVQAGIPVTMPASIISRPAAPPPGCLAGFWVVPGAMSQFLPVRCWCVTIANDWKDLPR
jgi:LacI family transcriptional regulator